LLSRNRSGQSTAFGKDAARYGSAALTRITEETEQRPLMAIVVALGVGILIGMADAYSGLDMASFTATADFAVGDTEAGKNLAVIFRP
jgi:hypothetical protein